MPVIIGERKLVPLDPARRAQLCQQLQRELGGTSTKNGPLIFQIPLERRDTFDIVVVWEAWKDVDMEDRRSVILEVYDAKAKDALKIDLALGVTYEEAMQQQLLPYAVTPLVRKGEEDIDRLREAMLNEGGFQLPDGNVVLRFPTMAMAEAAHRRLTEKLPSGYWSIAETIAP